MKSEHSANPADDEEIIELTDIIKSGPDAEEAIVDLTDVVETVKAESHDLSTAFDADQPLELGENAVVEADTTEALVDLTDALDPPEMAMSDYAPDLAEDMSDETQALIDRDDGAGDVDLDLDAALNMPDDMDAILDLDESLLRDDSEGETSERQTNDVEETAVDISEEIEPVPEVLDLAEALDASKEDSLTLDTPADDTVMMDEASSFDVSSSDVSSSDVSGPDAPEPELSEPDTSDLDVLVFDTLPLEDTIEVIETDPIEDTFADVDMSLDDDGVAELDLVDLVDTEENTGGASGDGASGDADGSDDILDLGQPVGPVAAERTAESTGGQAGGELFGAADAGDDLDFKLDEMLAEAQAEMPDIDDDGADMELDLSEALADAAADNTEEDSEAILDLNDPVDALDSGEAAADEADAFDLISEDKIIELDDFVAPERQAETATKQDNVIELADITGGYPTVNTTNEFESETLDNDDLPAEAESLLEDVFQDEENTDNSLVVAVPVSEDEDLDLDITLDGDGSAEDEDMDFQLNPEMEKLEATLDEVLQDDEGDDLDLGMFADSASGDTAVGADEGEIDADMAAISLTDAEAAPVATEKPVGDLHTEITEADLDAAVTRVIKTMYADRIEQMILDVIKEAVTAEIEKVKRSLGDNT
jgi:hypothetical protein